MFILLRFVGVEVWDFIGISYKCVTATFYYSELYYMFY